MIGHLGTRVSALLDGHLSQADEDRAWEHVHLCHLCRDQVEREGWVKTQLATLSFDSAGAPAGLKVSLLGDQSAWLACPPRAPGDSYLALPERPRRPAMHALGGGALGVAVLGLLALGSAPAAAPVLDRRPPTTSVSRPTEAPGSPGTLTQPGGDRARIAPAGAIRVKMVW